MQIGIKNYGAYIPIFRMNKSVIGKMWAKSAGSGEKAVANWDEDSMTMAIEACLDCLRGHDRDSIDGIIFASTTPPYREKLTASFMRKVLELKSDTFTADMCNSPRAGAMGLKVAMDAVKADGNRNYLVSASDLRLAAPNSALETEFGDGAAALLIGSEDVIATINHHDSISSEFIDTWRKDKDRFSQQWEDRFVSVEGYQKLMTHSIKAFLAKLDVKPENYTMAAVDAPNARALKTIAKKTGFTLGEQLSPRILNEVGNTGTANALMSLVESLERSKPGDRILLAVYGDGVDLFDITVTDKINDIPKGRGIERHLASKMSLDSYGTYLRFRDLLEWEFDRRLPDRTSLPMINRESSQIYSLHGSKCNNCGTIQYPVQRVCTQCQTKDDYKEIPLSHCRGHIFTFSMDQRAMVPDLPNVLSIVDLDGGGRFYSVMTDRKPESIEIGMPVEMTFRKIHEGLELYNYFWKTRPIRA